MENTFFIYWLFIKLGKLFILKQYTQVLCFAIMMWIIFGFLEDKLDSCINYVNTLLLKIIPWLYLTGDIVIVVLVTSFTFEVLAI